MQSVLAIRRLSALLLLVCVVDSAHPGRSFAEEQLDDRQTLVVRARKVVAEVVKEILADDSSARTTTIHSFSGFGPLQIVEDNLNVLLTDADPEVRLAASELLVWYWDRDHVDAIVKSLKDVRFEDSLNSSRLAVVRLKLGQPNALNATREWATLQHVKRKKLSEWVCPLHPKQTSKKQGNCPICNLQLIKIGFYEPTEADRHAQSHALAALAKRGDPLVEAVARDLLTGDAPSYWRSNAAVQWARIAPDEAHPHVEIFLKSKDSSPLVLTAVAEHIPNQFVSELREIAEDERQQLLSRLDSAAGLLKAGHLDFLDLVRENLDSEDDVVKYYAISLLSRYGNGSDLDKLEGLLDSEYRGLAASAILRIIEREKAGQSQK